MTNDNPAEKSPLKKKMGLGRGLEDFLPGDDIAGQRHHAHLGVADQMAADAFAAATEDIDHAAREDFIQRRRQGHARNAV